MDYVTAHRGRMMRIARLLTTGDAHWAEDLVQTALAKLYVPLYRNRIALPARSRRTPWRNTPTKINRGSGTGSQT
ncbi:sigma factor [Kribbella sp. VKM Ac-2566]|uniref:sigma factor n=1 Tax=Kribbella sp. VKM Ac-2566 TaxID=2512218 RepID=UPI0035199F2B